MNGKRDISPSLVTGKRNYGGSPTGGTDTFRVRLRIRAMLRAWGPMSTARLLKHLTDYPEAIVRAALQLLLENGEVRRPLTEQRWHLNSNVEMLDE